METKIDIISGFLGAGKTTLIKKLIDEKFKDEKIAIIENEFGEVSIDGDILKELKLNIKEIKSGCICCSLTGDLKESIISIIDLYSPERILIEPSGVAKLSDVIKACESLYDDCNIKLNMLVTVLDVFNAKTYIKNFGEFYKDQIKNAKIIILTRIETVSEEKIKETVSIIEEINPYAKIIREALNKIDFSKIINFEKDRRIDEEEQFKNYKVIRKNNLVSATYVKQNNHSAESMFSTWSLETKEEFSKYKLKDLFEEITKDKDYGFILRGKGIVKLDAGKCIQFHYVPGKFAISDINEQEISKICIIGSNINKSKLNYLFKEVYK
ncbi:MULTISPECIES: GTP-binding protein [unclassified Clostridium]|uniref:CobW family GTP-binding protein n=1 Tax=unclassified Clostridium TaxID=2614128 RepID=UPI0002974EBA|nr:MULTISPECIES: GTP-binding protein [unclassified Clostridium]EKQ57227.1 MAG: putative GTPase, G3E family [Clostridium sp. Maddingley MBC34-26]